MPTDSHDAAAMIPDGSDRLPAGAGIALGLIMGTTVWALVLTVALT